MSNTKLIRKGSIVVVMEGTAFGCAPQTITKVLSKPGRILDEVALLIGVFFVKNSDHVIICANNNSKRHCNNKPASYEMVDDLRLATDEEKKLFKLNNNQPIQL